MGKLEKLQEGDFYGIFEAMDGLPVVIRLIDPPLHEFLPNHEELLVEVTTMQAKGADQNDPRLRRGARAAARGRGAARAEPDARAARHPTRPDDPRPREDADARHPERRDQAQAGRRRPARRDHDPARRPRERAGRHASDPRCGGGAGRGRRPAPTSTSCSGR